MKHNLTRLICFLIVAQVSCWITANAHDFANQLPFPGGGVMNKLAVNPNINVVFSAVWGDGLYRSTDKGVTWIKSDAGLGNFFVNDILFDKNGVGFLATLGGIYKSTNNGTSWTQSSIGLTTAKITAMGFGPASTVLAGTNGSGIFISTDNGATWKNSRKGLKYQDIKTICTAQNGYILAGTYGQGIFMSRDSGKTWSANNTGLTNKFINHIILASNSLLYVATNGDGVYVSGNHGTSWSPYDTATLADKYITSLCINGQREVVAASRSRGVFYNDQNLWFRWKQATAFDQGLNSIVCDNTGYVIYANLWNNSYYSDDHARTFKSGGEILPIPDRFAIGAFSGGLIFAKYDNSELKRSTDYGANWISLGKTDVIPTCFAMDSAGAVYMGTLTGLFYSTDLGVNWMPADPLNGRAVNDIEISPQQEIFATTIKMFEGTPPPPPEITLYKSIHKTDWTPIRISTDKELKKMSIARTGEIALAVGENNVDLSTNNGATWTQIANFPLAATDLQFTHPGMLWIGGGKKMYRSDDFGRNWQQSDMGYESNRNYSLRNFAINPTGYVYAAITYFDSFNTRYDIRRSKDFVHWDSLSTGITMGEYNAIESDPEGNMLIARNNILRIMNDYSLGIPVWIAPAPLAEGIDSNFTFKWKTARFADLYELQYSAMEDFSMIEDWVVTSDTTFDVNMPLTLGTRYYARVRSKTNDQYSAWNVTNFMTKFSGPILISPLNYAVGVPYTIDLLWNSVNEANYYAIEVSEKSDFSTLAFLVDSTDKLTVKTPSLKPNTVYYWRVKALTKTNSSEWSEVWNFRTTLAAPILVSPAKNSLDHDKTVLLKWRKVDGAPSYDVEVSKTSDFAAPVATKTAVTDTTVTITDLEYNTKYFWRVSAGVTPIVGDWSEVWSFTTGIEPPTLLNPANNAAGLDPAVHFTWDFALTGAYKYEIQIDTALTFLSSPRPVTAKTYDTTGLPRSSKYFWRVRATLGAQKGFWSEAWSFSTKLGAPTLVYPADKSTNLALRIMSKWNQIKAAEFYFVQLAKDTLFTELVYSRDSVYATGFEFKDLEPNTKYFWRVRSANAASPSEWSEIWSFTTGANVPALLKPDDGAENQPVNLTLMWADIMGVPAFHVQVARDEQFANMYREEPEVAGSTLALTDLPKESKFYWRARSVNPSGASPWSEIRSFTTGKGGSAYESNAIAARISPNPASSELNAEFEISRPGAARIYILDALGRVALDLGERELATGRVSATFNISVLPSGSYRLIIVLGSDARAVAFIKID